MEPTQDLELDAPSRPDTAETKEPLLRKLADRSFRPLKPTGEKTVVWLHKQADKMDLVPTEFGQEEPVDEADAGSLLKEWMRQAKLWASYNPEEMLALKAGGVALGIALLVLVILVRSIR
jgi:hypothetical protein